MKKTSIITLSVLLALTFCLLLTGGAAAEPLDFSDPAMWFRFGGDEALDADVFFIAPTNVLGDADHMNADITDAEEMGPVLQGVLMQTQLYGEYARFYSPVYRQTTLACFARPEAEQIPYSAIAEKDVLDAFAWYMEHENNGRPVIIAGFSQGADMGLRILKAYAEDEAFRRQLVAAYLLGWRVTRQDLDEYPALKMAQGEDDTGVIICFECEAEDVTDTVIVPAGVFSYSINPLNWKTDSTPADKELNLGYVYPSKTDGSPKKEIPQLCGAYIDPVRGTLKVTDVTPEEYPPRFDIFVTGSYHIYDYEFFFRNVQANVKTRIDAYLNAK